ncbi:D-alanyl-D-alanine carboxypeptidase [Eikenella sp. S3360]|uniref:serine-type D-Ala-D-Ala carboxypeptidase n=1 Tax=Eikenella glucosivorans TaxID=2766967 RepID=A0ABS0NAW8_9NEIS|nr:D-alanyl-D-alanine carboxypeptidase family protein [Eikenella glucosivorans]MBH5329427.1 D-alanyl-D-alanine carboxypeptidase [Eikenella glucosivorans]
MKQKLTLLTVSLILAGWQAQAAPQAASAAANQASAPAAASSPAATANTAPAQASATAGLPEIKASAYAVFDAQSGQMLAAHKLNEHIEPASLTKLMTAYLVFKALEEGKLKPEQTFTVSEQGWKVEGSRMFLDPKTPASVNDLLKGLIVQSGNDASITLAEAVAGTEAQFVQLMNAEAKRLGMRDTNFENSTGLPGAQHYTSVQDLVTLSAAIIHDYPQYYPLYAIQSFSYNNITQPNRNLLLYRDPNVDGMKTGHTDSAGYNLVASSKRNGRRVISVVVGTESMQARAAESSKLLNWALQAYDTPKLYDAGTAISQVKVYKGAENAVNVGFLDATYISVPHGQAAQLQPVLETVQPVLAPITKGQVLGTVKFMDAQNRVVAQKDVVALEDVAEAGFFGRLWDSIVLWFKSMFSGS